MCGTGSCGGSGGCGSSGVSPLVINPIVSNPDLAGRYSVETMIKKSLSGGSAENAYTGVIPTTGTAADKKLAFQNMLLPVVGNMIRATVDDTFTDPTEPTTSTPYATLTAFRALFSLPAPTATLTAPQAKTARIVDNWYHIFVTGGSHAAVDPATAVGSDPCASAGGRLFTSKIMLCDFCVRLIMS